MDLDAFAAPEAINQEPAIKQEFASSFTTSFAPWNQFAPGELVIDGSSDDQQTHTDSVDNDEPEVCASTAFSALDSAPGTKHFTLDTAPSRIKDACRLAFKQDFEAFSKLQTHRLKTVKTTIKDRRAELEDGVPDICDQLPSLDISQTQSIWKDPAIPILLPEAQYYIKYWRVALFAGMFVYVDETAALCLQALAPDIPYQLLKPQMLDLSSLVVRRNKDALKLISSQDEDFEEISGDYRPSFNTLGRRAFTFYLRPHLNIIERRELQTFWASLPPFDPLKPNHDPARPSEPASPRKIGPTLWDWSDMLQPARWFICSCALADHLCAFTGEAPFNCRGWHDVCTEQICKHGPETRFIHTGIVCGPAFDGKPCGLGRNCRFQHGVAMVAKSIEHRLFHHRKA